MYDEDEDIDEVDETGLFGVELNGVAAVIIHRALKKYYETWPGGDPWEQQQVIQLKEYFYRLVLDVQMIVDVD